MSDPSCVQVYCFYFSAEINVSVERNRNEHQREKMILTACAGTEGPDQPVPFCNLIWAYLPAYRHGWSL